MLVKVNPKNRWAKNRVHEHGDTFKVLRKMVVKGKDKMLLESLTESWRLNEEKKVHWCGWFCEEDAEISEITS